jgi:hypothetical protein
MSKQTLITKDAEEWGNKLNEASWAAYYSWLEGNLGPMPSIVFNNLKTIVRAAILKYLEDYTQEQPKEQKFVELSQDDIDLVLCSVNEDTAKWDWRDIVEFSRKLEAKIQQINS